MNPATDETEDAFTIERHGEITLIVAAPPLESMSPTLVEAASTLLLEPLRRLRIPMVVVDLSRIDHFGSTFLALMLRCWKLATSKGGTMVVAGASERARELLHITSLDVVWPIYGTRKEAMEALLSD